MRIVSWNVKTLLRDCLQSPNSQSLSDELLTNMATYAEQCGDSLVAIRLRQRLNAK